MFKKTNNQFMMQAKNFNSMNTMDNQINLTTFKSTNEINVKEAQGNNKNMLKLLDPDYQGADQLIN